MRHITFPNGQAWYLKHHINKNSLKIALQKIALDEGFHVEHMSYILMSDKTLLDLNKKHLNHDYYTDIITFDLSERSGALNGEAYISKDSVYRNALIYSVPVALEFSRVAIHGFLHLCGYKDKTTSQRQMMQNKENLYLQYLEGLIKDCSDD